MAGKQKVFDRIEANRQQSIEFLQEMVRIPSVNEWFDDDEALKREGDAQRFIEKKLLSMDAEVELSYPDAKELSKYDGYPGYSADHTFDDRPNVYGEWKGSGGGKSILLMGHIDTVATGKGWDENPFGADIVDGKMYGRGVVDQKGGIAAMIEAVRAIRECGISLKGDVRVGTCVDEESGGMGTLAFVDKGYRADGCIMTEPTGLHIATLCRGIVWGKITVMGRSGHIELPYGDWRNGEAVDGIKKARMILDMIDNLNDDWANHKVHPLLRIPCQIEVGQIVGGEFPSTFAGKVEIYFDAAYLPNERDEFGGGGLIKKQIEDFVATIASTDPWLKENPPKVEWLVNADCAETPSDHPFVQACCGAMEQIGKKAVLEGAYFHTDMGWLERKGIPVINFGPGDPRKAHQNNEFLETDEYIECIKAIAAAIMDWCGVE